MDTYTMELTIKKKHQYVFFIQFLRKLGMGEIISLHEIQFNNKINKQKTYCQVTDLAGFLSKRMLKS